MPSQQKRNGLLWVLAIAVMVSSLAVVSVRHHHRLAYVQFMANEKERDSLNDEWGQLLVEEHLWASAHRIEKHAGERLSMRAPEKDEVEIVGAQDKGATVAGVGSATR